MSKSIVQALCLVYCVKFTLGLFKCRCLCPPVLLVSIWIWHCNSYTKNLLSQVSVNSSYYSFSALSINAGHPMAGQNREQSGTFTSQRKERGRFKSASRMGKLEPWKRGLKIQFNNNMEVLWDGAGRQPDWHKRQKQINKCSTTEVHFSINLFFFLCFLCSSLR